MGTFATREWPRQPLRPPKRIKKNKAAKKIDKTKKRGWAKLRRGKRGGATAAAAVLVKKRGEELGAPPVHRHRHRSVFHRRERKSRHHQPLHARASTPPSATKPAHRGTCRRTQPQNAGNSSQKRTDPDSQETNPTNVGVTT